MHAKRSGKLLSLMVMAATLALPSPASGLALAPTLPQSQVLVTIGTAAGKVGETIEVPVAISQPARGIASYGLELNYDQEALEALAVLPAHGGPAPACFGDDTDGCFYSDFDNTAGWVRAAWLDASGGHYLLDSATDLFRVRFKVLN
ncbi:MAG TPA: cohesin domain-containing protein, partial [Symbiobacteriaceae bacterium]|nr:cohesin domain-containing protein [Symbiobacteriaceae bacterium]